MTLFISHPHYQPELMQEAIVEILNLESRLDFKFFSPSIRDDIYQTCLFKIPPSLENEAIVVKIWNRYREFLNPVR